MEKFIKSTYFEKKFLWMRRASPYFNRKYNQLYDINIKEQPNVDNEDIWRAKSALKIFTKPLEVEFKKDRNIPKLIWMFWNTPIDKAPEVVKLSIRS
ncbi:MAG: capsular polysaccharide synthesis protein [Gammaproteobacteria bacterium]|nr:capsular polysaccharide synthesis protein [Gammaproteobacteria bacterium]